METTAKRQDLSIYIHIPFCERKCAYCVFNSFCAGEEERERYVDLLCKEMAARKTDRPISTIYIGGGTPSVLSEGQIEKIVKAIYANFNVQKFAEFTIEANPNSITQQRLEKWRGLKINRLSIGVQSLKDSSLHKIGRLHSRRMALEKVALAKKFFNNVSCDLIVGLEGESGKVLCKHAKELLELGVRHISCYLLEVYQNTPLFSMIAKKKYAPLSDDEMVAAFHKLALFLQDEGMQRYEISNFAAEGFESKHNLNYWKRGEYLGFGIGAHSFLDGRRSENAGTLPDYENIVQKCEFSSCDGEQVPESSLDFAQDDKRWHGIKKPEAQSEKNNWIFEKFETLSQSEENEEKIMLGLRCSLGVDISELQGYDLTKNPYFEEYISQGILRQNGNIVTLNPLFWHLSNTIISNLLPN